MKVIFSANMSNGPQLYSFRKNTFFYGAYHLLTFTEDDRGKELKVTVNTTQPVCWIELWPAAYDGHDWVRWTTERGQNVLASTGDTPQVNPSLTWEIQPGSYTLYFVNSNLTRIAKNEWIKFQIEVE